jgi:uncharacterized membrane protein YqaE (UPF0057 family)
MRYLMAFFLPPVAVLLCGKPVRLCASVPLTLCLWVPGVVHALVVVRRQATEERAERLAAVVLASEERLRRGRRARWHATRALPLRRPS